MNGVIYCTTNLINNKKYIGKDKNNNSNYLGSGVLLHLAFHKYGRENFVKEILQDGITSMKDLKEAENYWGAYFGVEKSDLFYNIATCGEGGYLGKSAGEKISPIRKECFNPIGQDSRKV